MRTKAYIFTTPATQPRLNHSFNPSSSLVFLGQLSSPSPSSEQPLSALKMSTFFELSPSSGSSSPVVIFPSPPSLLALLSIWNIPLISHRSPVPLFTWKYEESYMSLPSGSRILSQRNISRPSSGSSIPPLYL